MDIDYRNLQVGRRTGSESFSLAALEYDKLRELLIAEAMSAPGRERASKLEPSSDLGEVRWRLAETADFIDFVLERGELSLTSAEEIRPLLIAVEREVLPRYDELNRLARFLRVVSALRKRLPAPDGENYAEEMKRPVYSLLEQLAECRDLRLEIERCVASDEDLHDDASAELKRIRRAIIRTQDEVKLVLERLMRSQKDSLQDQLVTLRNGRYVLPVKSSEKNTIKGLVHDASASGQTLFIEPLAVVELNNKLRELEFEEGKEIERILRNLGAQVATEADDLRSTMILVADLDFAQAKARLALKQEAHCPTVNDAGRMRLKAARHPLIPKSEVVPIDFELGYDFDSLLITGPNTGGKTVSLKTCGLFTLMAMSGLAIPAASGSEISVFGQVLADIGDEQSIEQSLSTFSAHLKNLIQMLEASTERSLVLCDELGSGTDPSEGAALAIALIDAFRSKGASLVATTHYQELKGYALNTAGISNACCEFDTQTLRPTYKLLIGVPGVSNALAIAQRLGLDAQIIDHARALISDEGQRFSDLISAIEQSKQEAVRLESEIAKLHEAAAATRAAAEAERDKLAQEAKSKLAAAEAEALELIEAARAEIAAEIAQKEAEFARFAEEAKATSSKEDQQQLSSLKGLQSRLQKQASKRAKKLGKQLLQTEVKRELEPEDIVVGAYYRAPALNFSGQAVEPPDKRGLVQLAKGQVKLTVDIRGLVPAEAPKSDLKEQRLSYSARKLQAEASSNTATEIKLLGMRVEEALHELDQAIDRAQLANFDIIRVVHGKGSGALRSAVRAKANSDSRIADYREAGFGEGDSGVTYLELKNK
ncbi:MAG: endonuclease MutS2 [Eubacteriales bacterium]|nr:endonuclease MutS2 [Eubacteriales bacterium]